MSLMSKLIRRHRDHLGEFAVAGNQVGGGKTTLSQQVGEFIPREHSFKFFDERATGVEPDLSVVGGLQQLSRNAAPEKCRHPDVGVRNAPYSADGTAFAPDRLDLGLNFILRHRRQIEGGQLVHRIE